MTSTAVKEVGSLFANMTVAQAGRNSMGVSDFQAVWNNQMSKNAQENASQENTAPTRKQDFSNEQLQQGSSLKAKDSQAVQEDSENAEDVTELSPEEQEQAMAVLGNGSEDHGGLKELNQLTAHASAPFPDR